MNKQEQKAFFQKEIEPYVQLRIKEAFDDLDRWISEEPAFHNFNYEEYTLIKSKHLTDNFQ